MQIGSSTPNSTNAFRAVTSASSVTRSALGIGHELVPSVTGSGEVDQFWLRLLVAGVVRSGVVKSCVVRASASIGVLRPASRLGGRSGSCRIWLT